MLDGKRALITGARKGIGRGIALTFAAQGATVGVNDIIDDEASRRTTELAASHGAPASFHQADVSSVGGIVALVDEFVERQGGIDIIVNNAIFPDQVRPLFDIDEGVWDRVMNLSLKGYFFGAQHAARYMVDQGTGGRIVCIASVHAYQARREWTPYGTAKAALLRLVKGLAVDLSATGITANCVSPGAIANALPTDDDASIDGSPVTAAEIPLLDTAVPLRRGGLPSDIANAVLYLCSDMGAYVNGEAILVDGGLIAHGIEG